MWRKRRKTELARDRGLAKCSGHHEKKKRHVDFGGGPLLSHTGEGSGILRWENWGCAQGQSVRKQGVSSLGHPLRESPAALRTNAGGVPLQIVIALFTEARPPAIAPPEKRGRQ